MLNIIKSASGGRRKIAAAIGAGALIAASILPVLAATEGVVTATVTLGVISVSVSPGSVAYGTVGVPTANNVPQTPSVDQVITASNDGGIPETFNIKGANATFGFGGSKDWTITTGAVGGATTYNYNHKFNLCTDNALACTITAGLNTMDANYEILTTDVAASASRYFKLALSTPTETGGDTTEHSTSVTVQAVAF